MGRSFDDDTTMAYLKQENIALEVQVKELQEIRDSCQRVSRRLEEEKEELGRHHEELSISFSAEVEAQTATAVNVALERDRARVKPLVDAVRGKLEFNDKPHQDAMREAFAEYEKGEK